MASYPQQVIGANLFRPDGRVESEQQNSEFVRLGDICYVSVGMVIHCDEKKAQGSFKAEDLISDHRDESHPKRYAEGKDIARYGVKRVRYLEYGTRRAPSMFRRPTFPELYKPDARLLARRMCGDVPIVAFDDTHLMTNHTAIVFVPWHALHGVRNQSIKKTAKYRKEVKASQAPPKFRDELEAISKRFDPKYLLAVMNSSFATEFLNKRRRSKLDIYPDDWKMLPVPVATAKEQSAIATLVDRIMKLVEDHRASLEGSAAHKFAELDNEINERVGSLYKQKASAKAN